MIAPVRQRWWLVLGFAAATLGLVLLQQAITTPTYTASTVLSPTIRATATGTQGLGGLGALGAIAGGALGQGTVTDFDRFQYIVKSDRIGEYQALRRGMLQVVFRSGWDARTRRWVKPGGFAQGLKDAIFPVFNLPSWLPPDGRTLAEHYDAALAVKKIGDTSLIELNYKDPDPVRGQRVLAAIIEDANELLRQDASRRAKANAQYLREQLAITQIADYRSNLTALLGHEEQTLMLAAAEDLPYAAETLQPVTVSRTPTSQRPILFGIIAIVVGLSLGVLTALILGEKRAAATIPSDETD